MSNRHKWADVIHAFAEGKEIQWRFLTINSGEISIWEDIPKIQDPQFNNSCIEWRIKPEPKSDIRVNLWRQDKEYSFHLTFVFDGETKAFKTVEYHDD